MTQALPARSRRDPLPSRESLGQPATPPSKPARLVSLDAYRGLIMIFLASGGFALGTVAHNARFRDDPAWEAVSFQTDHVEWQGGTLANLLRHDEASEKANRLGDWFGGGVWDLIQPSFMFMAGVSIPFSYTARRARGDSTLRVWLHVFVRAFLLVALGIFLRSTGTGRRMTNYTFEDVITQIGLGYPFVFLVYVIGRRVGAWPAVYAAALVAILGGYWAYFAYWPLPSADFDYGSVGLESGPWPWKEGLFAHWSKNTNAAQSFDFQFLNLFPRPSEWKFNGGGYLTLNFVPSMATAIFGMLAGELLRVPGSKWRKFLTLVALGVGCLAAGAYAGETVCPIVKRIWTPSWAVYAAGWTFLLLAAFYGIIDCIGFRWWAFPLVVVGMNSIAIYCMEDSPFKDWLRNTLQVHLRTPVHGLVEWYNRDLPEASQLHQLAAGEQWYNFLPVYGPIVQATTILLVFWLILFWMYRRKIFLKL
jgi:heparan-alpha-glucosaminide N-acetyltransferase